MGVPLIQQYRLATYIFKQKLSGKERYPLVLMLEPLFRCNLTCAGCGKIEHPEEILNKYLSVDECLSVVDECNAPVVSIAGGEPLLHKEMDQIVAGIIKRKKFVYLCTNGLLLKKHLDDYPVSPYLTFSVHLDGNRERHDAIVCRQGVFDVAVDAIRAARDKGFRVTINSTLFEGVTAPEAAEFFDFAMGLGIEGITVAPGFNYERASQQEVFLQRTGSKQLFRDILKAGRDRRWKFNHTILYLDFLAGNRTYHCTPWGNPTRNIFGWQRPCYLLEDDRYASSFKELIEDTDWDSYGTGRSSKCAHCMLHSGFEPSAVDDMFKHPFKALGVYLRGPRTDGPMVPDILAEDSTPTYESSDDSEFLRPKVGASKIFQKIPPPP
ncbi:MAG: adenosyl-hopene transferase HpnH [Deltaproteobacteria bacterium]|nr:adenosyl-hopene transferase HpnH [Deltaproteobacteria bacterium]